MVTAKIGAVATNEVVEEDMAKDAPEIGSAQIAATTALPAVTLATDAALPKVLVAVVSTVETVEVPNVAVDSGKATGCVAAAITTLLAVMNATVAVRRNRQVAEVGPPTGEMAVMVVASVVKNATRIADTAMGATVVDLPPAATEVEEGPSARRSTTGIEYSLSDMNMWAQ